MYKYSKVLWNTLAGENRFDLIDLLNKVEKKESGFTTVVIPKSGFSDNEQTHNMIIDWLKCQHGINVINTRKIIHELKQSRSWR